MKNAFPSRILPCLMAVVTSAGGQVLQGSGSAATRPGAGEFKYEAPKYLTGSISARDGNRLLFTFKRGAVPSDSLLNVERDYSYPDGRLAARERVVYTRNELVSYELDETQIGARGSATIHRSPADPSKGTIEFTYSPAGDSRPKMSKEVLRENTLIADMVAPFLLSRWDALLRGEKIRCRYIVVPRCETVGFTFVKDSTNIRAGQPVIIIRMEPTSPFVAALVNPLYFTFEQSPPHRVVQYAGRTTPKIQINGQWQDLDAVTVFDWASAR